MPSSLPPTYDAAKDRIMKEDDTSFFPELIQIFANSSDAVVRRHALALLMMAASRWNTRFACPASVVRHLTDDERLMLSDIINKIEKTGLRAQINRFPNILIEYSDINQFGKVYFSPKSAPFITKSSKIITFGSCFAGNVASFLAMSGYDAWNCGFLEFFNNSFTNRGLIEASLDPSAMDDFLQEDWSVTLPDLRGHILKFADQLKDADVLVFTLGLSYAFFSVDTGEPLRRPLATFTRSYLKQYDMRPIEYSENVENVRAIIRGIRKVNTRATIIFTLSPVPLDGIIDETASVVEADCVSKSIGRATLAEVERRPEPGFGEIIYFPSFELVRWVGCNQTIPLFGHDDGWGRHVSNDVISAVMEVFCDFYCVDRARPADGSAVAPADGGAGSA